MPTSKKPKPPPARHVVHKGDLVKFHSPLSSYTGDIGEVTHVVDKKRVIVRTIGNERYERFNVTWVVETSKPRGKDKVNGCKKWERSAFIKEVLYRRTEFVPKPPKPGPVVLHTMDQLRDHLASDRAAEKVVFIPVEEGGTTP